jgi:hypothetical protein
MDKASSDSGAHHIMGVILMQANARERLKLQVMPLGIKAMDDLSATILKMKLSPPPRSPETFSSDSLEWASIHKLPLKNADWKESLQFATSEQLRHYHRCFMIELRDSLAQMSRIDLSDKERAASTKNVLDLLGDVTALSRFVLNFNPLAFLTNVGRNLETGDFNEDEQSSRSLAAFTLNFISPAHLEKLRGGLKVYEERLSKIRKEKTLLSSILSYHLKISTISPPSQEQSISYLRDLATLPREVQNLLLGTKNWPKMHQLIFSDTFISSLPTSPEQVLEESLSQLIQEVEGYGGSTDAVDQVLSCIQRTVHSEVAARSVLLQVGRETVSPLVVANVELKSYPYLMNLPKLIADCLTLRDSNQALS